MADSLSNAVRPENPISAGASRCFHCAEPCPDDLLLADGKNFCCVGCRTVYGLLHDTGLDQFYVLQPSPGSPMRNAASKEKWGFLDDPLVAGELLDFAGGSRAKVTLHLPAIHCVACVWLLENLFKLHPGVGKSLVNFPRREVSVTFASDKIRLSELAALLTSIGYEPQFTLGQSAKSKPSALGRRTWLQLGVAGFAFGNIMIMSLPFYLGLDSFNGPWFKSVAGWLGLLLALPVVSYSAGDFWRTAFWSIRQRVLTMEVPLALGLAAIYFSSAWDVALGRGPGYCDSLCALVFALLCGRVFQRRTYDRIAFDRDYKGFFPLSVMRATHSGRESVAISRLQVGDRIIVRHGELIPADAQLVDGEALIDYSFVTGESAPVPCGPGSHLYAGGRQLGASIVVETVKPVAQSYLASLWDNEAFRKEREVELDSLTNRYSRRFTKIIVVVALVSAGFWLWKDPSMALKVFASVLIVACPCALALAAPLAHGMAQRVLSGRNVYLKNGLTIERMAAVDAVVLDKTGTLTMPDERGVVFVRAGNAQVKPESKWARLSDEEAAWVVSLARHSTHPNSVRVTAALDARALPVSGFREIPGCGLEGVVAGRKILLGSRSWVAGECGLGTEFPMPLDDSVSGVWVAVNGVLLGAFALHNSLRPEVGQLIRHIGARFEMALLSGDNEREAPRFKPFFGESAVMRFNQSPSDKLEFIRELQRRGRRVMMVGDGLNDAGALRQAEVGVAVVESAGVFSPASDVILDAGALPGLGRILIFSKGVARIVRAGFVISALYNVAGVAIAAAGLLEPVVCAILMPLSSVTMILFACGSTSWLGRSLKTDACRGGQPAGEGA